SDDQGADDVNPDTHRQDPGSRHPTWKRALWYGFVGLLIFIALGSAAIAALQDRTKYELHVVIESGQIIVPAGMGGPTRQTLDSRDFKASQPAHLVTDRDPNKGAGVWLVTWLAAEYAANRPDLPFTVTVPIDLLTDPIAVTGLNPDEYQLYYQVAGGEKVRL